MPVCQGDLITLLCIIIIIFITIKFFSRDCTRLEINQMLRSRLFVV